jgi:hypothetical protein
MAMKHTRTRIQECIEIRKQLRDRNYMLMDNFNHIISENMNAFIHDGNTREFRLKLNPKLVSVVTLHSSKQSGITLEHV